MSLLHLKDPLELIVKIREFHPDYGFLSRRDMTSAVESDVKQHPFFLIYHPIHFAIVQQFQSGPETTP